MTSQLNSHDKPLTNTCLDLPCLLEDSRFCKDLMDAFVDEIVILDETGTILFANRSWLRFAENNHADLNKCGVGVNYLTICERATGADALVAQDVIVGIRRVIDRTQDCFQMEYPCHSKNEKRWFVLNATRIKTQGETRILIVHENATPRKRLEEAMHESERLYRQAIEIADAVPYIRDYQVNEYLFVGEGIAELTGYTADEFSIAIWRSNVLETVLLGELAGMEEKEAIQFAREGKCDCWRADYRIRHRNGEERWLANAAVEIREGDNPPTGSLGILQDITDRKLAEEERERLNNQLRQSQKLEAVGQLAGGIAHDFNNLLQVILGYIDLAKIKAETDDRLQRDLDMVRVAAEKAANLTRQLLTFSRRQIVKPTSCNVNQIIRDLVEILHRIIGEHVALEVRTFDNLAPIHADRSMIEQVILNLCVNSRDAMPDGGELLIQTDSVMIDDTFCRNRPWAKTGQYIRIKVSDTGIGIPVEIRERIFEPFFTTKAKDQGTGLGLATVYGIVKQHNGMIDVFSEVGKGTTFDVYFPIVTHPLTEEMNGDSPAVTGGNETILLVEDEPLILELNVRLLQDRGYRVLIAHDGEEAVEIFNANADSIHLVVLDVVMPRRSGRSVYETIREVRPALPVLFCSGYSTESVDGRFLAGEGVEIIAKPISPERLLHKIRETLDRNLPSVDS